MKAGRTLADLAQEIERQNTTKRDFVADTRNLKLNTETAADLSIGSLGQFPTNDQAHRQIGSRLNIPAKYYDRMRESHPDVLAHSVNALFQREPEKRMVRTLDGNARAFLSDRYLPLDNYELAEAALPTLLEKDLTVQSCEITESKLYVKASMPELQQEIKVGQVVEAGIQISNSEIGMGSFQVCPIIVELRCLNGWTAPIGGLKRHHVGRNGSTDSEEAAHEFYRDDTRQALDAAFWRQVRDTIDHVLTAEVFNRVVGVMQEGADRKITNDPVEAVAEVQKRLGLTDDERGGVLRHLIEGADLSALGVGQAITRHAQDVESYDRASQLERDGFKVLELSQSDWKVIAN